MTGACVLPSSRREAGWTMLELMVVVGITSILAGTAVSAFRSSLYDLDSTAQQVEGNLRLARAQSIANNVHHRVRVITDRTYALERMRLQGTTWVLDRALQTLPLPPSIRFTNAVNTTAEFDTRGMLVQPTARLTLTIEDVRTRANETVEAFPSGQIVQR